MRIAVTGGTGNMGRSVIPYLIEQGHSVVSIDRVPPQGERNWEIRHITADTRDFGEFIESLRDCDALVHLAAIPAPGGQPNTVVYSVNTISSYNALEAASLLGIKRVCLASSINAIGGAFSRMPRYDYFPVDEKHPTYSEEPYALSKWVLEQQGDMFARRYEWMTIASLRFHWLMESREKIIEISKYVGPMVMKHLWAYTLLKEANRAILLSLTADFKGHEAFYIVAPRTTEEALSEDLARQHFPNTPLHSPLPDHAGFFDCSKAKRLLGWEHEA